MSGFFVLGRDEIFILKRAQIHDRAFIAFGFSGDTDIASVQDQPMMRVHFEFVGNYALQFFFDFFNIGCGGKVRPVAYPENMRIHRHGRLAERHV